MNTESERGKAPKPSKKKSKKNKKGLDKIPNLWYNKDVSKREKKSPADKSLAVAKRHENLAIKKMKEVDTMTEKKMTKREYINRILTYAHDEDKAYLEHELELLDKKNSAERKPTAKQVENAGIKDAIMAWMEQGVLYACADVAKTCPACEGISTNRVSALLTQLGKDGLLTVTEDKRKHFYSIAE